MRPRRSSGRASRKTTLIAFRLAKYDPDEASELAKRLCGRATSSHGGKYVCRRRRLLDEIPCVRLIRGVVIVRTEDAARAVRLLEEMEAEVHAKRVELTTEGRSALREPSQVRVPRGFV